MAYSGSVPDTAARPRDWMERAACRDEDPEIFHDAQFQHEARTVCVVQCPVRATCLNTVMERERGRSEGTRDDCIIGGLDRKQRWRNDPTAPGKDQEDRKCHPDPDPRCGTAAGLERHLAAGKRPCDRCWNGELRRHRKATRRGQQPAAVELVQESGPAAEAPAVEPSGPQQADPKPKARGDTPHERRVYRLWSGGYDDLQIARRMAISVPQVQRVRERLGLLPHLHVKAS